MRNLDLGRYPAEVNGLAEELDSFLDEIEVRDAGVAAFREHGDALFAMSEDQTKKALKFLSQTPSQRTKAVARMGDTEAAVLILRARYLCMMSYAAMQFAEDVSHVKGMGFRAAAEYAARIICGKSFVPAGSSVVRTGYRHVGRY